MKVEISNSNQIKLEDNIQNQPSTKSPLPESPFQNKKILNGGNSSKLSKDIDNSL